MTVQEQFIVDANGKKVGVILSLERYQELMEDLRLRRCGRASQRRANQHGRDGASAEARWRLIGSSSNHPLRRTCAHCRVRPLRASFSVLIGWYPRLAYGTPEERAHFQFGGAGHGIHWPDLDEDISIQGLLLGLKSAESQASFARWLQRRAKPRNEQTP